VERRPIDTIYGDVQSKCKLIFIHNNFNDKSVSVFFPPARHNNSVAAASKGFMILGRRKLSAHQFPNEIMKSDGYRIVKPTEWT
jgi:hypothetical protein